VAISNRIRLQRSRHSPPPYCCSNHASLSFLLNEELVSHSRRLSFLLGRDMKSPRYTTLFGRLSLFFSIILYFHSLPTLANPINSRSLSSTFNYEIPQAPGMEIVPHGNHDTALSTLPKRGFITYYNNLGAWKMVLTSAALLLNSATNKQAAAEELAKFLTSVATGAAAKAASGGVERNAYDFGIGAVSLAFQIRGDILTNGRGPQTIPWSLVELLATQFLNRVRSGNTAAFTGVVTGPLAGNQYGSPWIQVVLQVGGKVIMDGIPFSVE